MKQQTQPYGDWLKELKRLAQKNGLKKFLKQIWEPELINFYGDGYSPNETLNELMTE